MLNPDLKHFFPSKNGYVYVRDLIQSSWFEMNLQLNIPYEGKDNVGIISRMQKI